MNARRSRSLTTLLTCLASATFPFATHVVQGQPPVARGRDAWVAPSVRGQGLSHHVFPSDAVGEDVSYLLYLPLAYHSEPNRKFPVVYWLHGIGGGQYGAAGFTERLQAAIEAGKCPPLIVVFVNGRRASMYCDSADGAMPVESMIIQDLIPHIDATYRTVASRSGRMVEGFSMGGFGAAHLGFKYPELFGSVSIISGALHDEQSIERMRGPIFTAVFGGEAERFRRESPWVLAEKNAAQLREKTSLRIALGDQDKVRRWNEPFSDLLKKLRIEHEYRVVENAGHNHGQVYDGLAETNWAFYRQVFGLAFTAEKKTTSSTDWRRYGKLPNHYQNVGLEPGAQVPTATMYDLHGNEVDLRQLWSEKPVALITASLTCPIARARMPDFERLREKYQNRVNFAVLYIIEAHPVGSNSPYYSHESRTRASYDNGHPIEQPQLLDRRLALAKRFQELNSAESQIVVDGMDNEAWELIAPAPCQGLLIGTEGRVIAKQGWFQPDQMEQEIRRLLSQ